MSIIIIRPVHSILRLESKNSQNKKKNYYIKLMARMQFFSHVQMVQIVIFIIYAKNIFFY